MTIKNEIKFKVITEEQEEYGKLLGEYLNDGWLIEGGTYNVFEYCGLIRHSIVLSKTEEMKK